MPMPAGSSRRAVASSQPVSPKESRTAGSAMPSPSSQTVTPEALVGDGLGGDMEAGGAAAACVLQEF